jgi:hypothetical protein
VIRDLRGFGQLQDMQAPVRILVEPVHSEMGRLAVRTFIVAIVSRDRVDRVV